MSLFQIKWLRRLLRRNMVPVPQNKAANWKQRFSVAYMLLAWNAFGVVCYMVYTGRKDWADYYGYKTEEEKNMSPGLQWAKTLKIDQAKVVRFSGLKKVDEFDYKRDENKTGDAAEDKQLLVEVLDAE